MLMSKKRCDVIVTGAVALLVMFLTTLVLTNIDDLITLHDNNTSRRQ